jgi:CMP-N-acetylneuraminic acid synthetase
MADEKQSTKIVALVPMRHESERVKGKNYREIGGQVLYGHILQTLLDCKELSQIVVDTDSDIIQNGIKEDFPDVLVIERPEKLRGGEIPMNDILLHDTSVVKADCYLQTHSTNPLIASSTISRAIESFLDGIPEIDSLFSVTELHTRLYDDNGEAINHNPKELLRTQDLAPIYEENSCLYMFSQKTLVEHGHRLGQKPLMFTIPMEEAWDIDNEIDFQIAEFLLGQKKKN